MSQPIKKILLSNGIKKPKKKPQQRKKKHPEYGTSNLEKKFANEFLDKLGVSYTYQFKVASIGRYFDFKINPDGPFIEIDGDYYHAYGKLYEEMSPMQKKNNMVDRLKDAYCSRNGFKLIRIWEHDINSNPSKVMDILKKELFK